MDRNVSIDSPKSGNVYRKYSIIALAMIIGFIAGLLTYRLASDSTFASIRRTRIRKFPSPDVTRAKTPSIYYVSSRPVRPSFYDIKIIPFLYEGNFTFSGDVTIIAKIYKETKDITLHANNLTINNDSVFVTEVSHKKRENIIVEELETVKKMENFVVRFKHKLKAGTRLKIHLKYTGVLNDLMSGFYRNKYLMNNHTRWIAATHFSPTDARRAFPCFDEPALKAKFKISIARPNSMSSLSNMPLEGPSTSVDDMPGYYWDKYQVTPPMSTYLVAFVITNFQKQTNGNISVWTRPGLLSQAQYALEICRKMLIFYENYFQTKYSLPKLDIVAMPDLEVSALENWGLIIFRESSMLFEEGISTNTQRKDSAFTLSHDLVHQWFGNLVTPYWWSELWLSEGFASYFENIGVNSVHPTWKVMQQFIVNRLHGVLYMDSLKSSRPLSSNIDPSDVASVFDYIPYSKGASIIRMLEHIVTTSVFKEGIRVYLDNNQFSTVKPDDLWMVFSNQTDLNVKQVMDTWILQSSYPLITAVRNYSTQTVVVTQSKYGMNTTSTTNVSNSLWWVPLSYTSQDNPDFRNTSPKEWIPAVPNITISNLSAKDDDWLVLNIQQTGYYRVNYDSQNWILLTQQLQDPKAYLQISTINRAQILDDVLNFAEAGLLDYATALNVTTYLKHESEYVPWKAAWYELNYIGEMFLKTGHYDKYRNYMLHLILPFYNKIGFRDDVNESLLNTYKRLMILQAVCEFEHPDCIKKCVHEFQNWKKITFTKTQQLIISNIKQIVYCTTIKHGDQDDWNFVLDQYLKTDINTEKELHLYALACSRNIAILSHYLNMVIANNSAIRKQDALTVFNSVASNSAARSVLFNYLKNNFQKINQYFQDSSPSRTILYLCSTYMNTQEELQMVKKFIAENMKDISEGKELLERTVKQIENNIYWMNKYFQAVLEWLSDFNFSE